MKTSSRRKRLTSQDLYSLTDEELLLLKFKDLPISLRNTDVSERVKKLYEELKERGLRFKPHTWLSDEWFCADGIPGIAIPFYLAHPRLIRLEQKMMFEAEGMGERECMRILRHEAGHAIDNAYVLHGRKLWQHHFGLFRAPYPKFYRPKPASRRYVVHLNNWYAQAHPAEDFAETFAVWLTPGSRWKQSYESWPAISKLEYVDAIMAEIGKLPPTVQNRSKRYPLYGLNKTLTRHYQERQGHYHKLKADLYTTDLQKLFSSDAKFTNRITAASLIRGVRKEIRTAVAYWANTHQYTVDQVLEGMTERSKQLKLRLTRSERDTKQELTILVTAATMDVIHSGRNRVAL
jgi:hypothetical protein